VSQLIDTITINAVAWSGMMSVEKIIGIMVSAYTLKLFIAFALTPMVYVCHAFVQRVLGLEPVILNAAGEVVTVRATPGE
jgi:uncharacterized PurR-regulated membrane protein YhhQ (DUF165 family)